MFLPRDPGKTPDSTSYLMEKLKITFRLQLLVLDHSKFGRRAHVRSGSICDVDTVYCDRPPPGDISDLLRSAGTELVICKRESGP